MNLCRSRWLIYVMIFLVLIQQLLKTKIVNSKLAVCQLVPSISNRDAFIPSTGTSSVLQIGRLPQKSRILCGNANLSAKPKTLVAVSFIIFSSDKGCLVAFQTFKQKIKGLSKENTEDEQSFIVTELSLCNDIIFLVHCFDTDMYSHFKATRLLFIVCLLSCEQSKI